MHARIKEERELQRLGLASGALAGASGAVVFMVAIARWQLDAVTTQALWITGAWATATLAMAWRAVRRLTTYLKSREDEQDTEDDEKGAKGGA